MKKTYSLFIIGFILAIPIPLIDDLFGLEEFSKNPSYVEAVKTGTNVWMFSYLVILAIIIPMRTISSFYKRLSERQLLALSFVAGQSFGFVIIRLITFSF